MTSLVPRDEHPPVPVPATVIPLPFPLNQALPSLAGDQMREAANILLGAAAFMDWAAANVKASRCNVCSQVFDARAIDAHRRDEHTPAERVLAWIGWRPR